MYVTLLRRFPSFRVANAKSKPDISIYSRRVSNFRFAMRDKYRSLRGIVLQQPSRSTNEYLNLMSPDLPRRYNYAETSMKRQNYTPWRFCNGNTGESRRREAPHLHFCARGTFNNSTNIGKRIKLARPREQKIILNYSEQQFKALFYSTAMQTYYQK